MNVLLLTLLMLQPDLGIPAIPKDMTKHRRMLHPQKVSEFLCCLSAGGPSQIQGFSDIVDFTVEDCTFYEVRHYISPHCITAWDTDGDRDVDLRDFARMQ